MICHSHPATSTWLSANSDSNSFRINQEPCERCAASMREQGRITLSVPSVLDYVRFQLLATPMTILLKDKIEPEGQAIISSVA